MNTETNVKTVQQVYENFKGGHSKSADAKPGMQSLLGLYADDIEWNVPEMENVRLGGKRSGLESVKEFFSTVTNDYEILQLEPQGYIAQGDNVVTWGHYSWRVKATGKEFNSDWAHVYTVRNGKIVKFQEYLDTAAEIKAHQKRN